MAWAPPNWGVWRAAATSLKKTYIGQSKRNLKTRLEEHDPITFGKSDVTDHLRENPDHTIDFHNPLILAQETNWRKLRIKETLYRVGHK